MLSGSDDLAPGVTFGGYVVRELIGRGGMASVYRAEHMLLEKPVALKVMDRSLLASSIGLQRFLREGRAAAAIKHPNVVDINDVGVHEGVPYLVMELLRGDDLDRHLRKHRQLDNAATVRIALPVIAALHTAHASGVVHRDIKPSNIFMSVGPDDQLVPKVLDFGISKMAFDRATIERAATPQNQIIGTPQYLPPEALHGVGEMGPLSDQYSLGVVLYQCVTGRPPFAGETLLALLESLARGTFERPRVLAPDVSEALERVILRALSAAPRDRFPTIRDMGRALVDLAAHRTQVVWRQTFATPAHGHDASTAAGVDVPSSRGAAPSGDFLLTPASERRAARWRSVGIGAGLVLTGALAASLWSALVDDRGAAGDAANRPAARGAAAGLPAPAAVAAPAALPGRAALAPELLPAPSDPAAPSALPGSAAGALGPSTRVLSLAPGEAAGAQPSSASSPSPGDDARSPSDDARRADDDALPSALLTGPASSRSRAAAARASAGKSGERTAKAKKGRGAKAKARRTASKGGNRRREASRGGAAGSDTTEGSPAAEAWDVVGGGVAEGSSPPDDAAGAPSTSVPSPSPPGPSAPGTSSRSTSEPVLGANGAPILD